MRYLVLSLLLFLGGQLPATTLYVWAPSGLSLRAAGKAGAEKLAVIPHGAAVQTTNQVGDELTVTALPEWHEGEIHSEVYRLRGSYVKVRYDDTEGYVFSAYLLPYPAPQLRVNKADSSLPPAIEDFSSWCERLYGQADTVYYDQDPHYRCLTQYSSGIQVSWQEYEGGGGSNIIVPKLSLQQGFVFFDTFHGYSRKPSEPTHIYPYPMAVDKVTYDRIELYWEEGAFESNIIQVIGGFLIFHSAGGC